MSEKLARKFHEVYERLAPSHGYKTREETREFDPKSPNGRLMIRVCGEVCGEQQDEIERLRELLRKSREWLYRGECDFDLLNEIEKELFEKLKEEIGDE